MKRTIQQALALTAAGGMMSAWADMPVDNSTGTPATSSQLMLAQAGEPAAQGNRGVDRRRIDSGEVEEVVVTAQRREEKLQKVPISIAVLGGVELDQTTAEGITEMLNRVSGVSAQVSYIGGGTQVSIRGVAASSPILHGSSPVAYYLDSVPFGLIKTPIAPDANAYDMQRVEVLRGPQGTLYGASALNGVVRVLTNDADLDDFMFKARTSISTTEGGGENYRGDMAVNVPLIEDKLAVRAVVGYEDLGGWIDRPTQADANDAELRNVRLKVNGRPSDDLSVGLSAWVSRNDYGAPPLANDEGANGTLAPEPMATDYEVYGLKIGYDFAGFSLSSMTGYLEYNNEGVLNLVPLFGVNAPFVNKYWSDVVSQEIVLNSTSAGSWRWSVGGIYRDAEDRTFQSMEGFFPAPSDFDDTSESFAVYGELTRIFGGGAFELTAGLRYFEDKVGLKENVQHTGVPTDPLARSSSTFDAVTPRVVLTWHSSEQLTTYVSYGEGFRSGFEQQPLASQVPPCNEDTLQNYEIGAKGTAWDGRLTFDTAVYYIDWQDVQNDFSVLVSGVAVPAIANSGSASGPGIDFGLTVEPVDGLQFGINLGWNDLTWDNRVPFGTDTLFEKGERLNLSPEYIAGASVDYAFPLGSLEARFSASANYSSEQVFRTTFGRGTSDEILIARTSFGIESTNNWTATLYIDNVNNEDGILVGTPFGVPDWQTRTRPRTMGLQLEYRF